MRTEIDISKNDWFLWLDKTAEWENDTLFAPSQVNLRTMLVNSPTGGWSHLEKQINNPISLPACVEEYCSGGINDWEYRGVSWFFTYIDVPANLKGKRVVLEIEKTRLRAEIFINQKLAGYDLVSETPYFVDISQHIRHDKRNCIAIRITNAGGTRGWNDILSYKWGNYELMPSHDFSVVGHIHLVATNQTYINDIFVKNRLPAMANNIEITAEIINDEFEKGKLQDATIEIDIIDNARVESVFKKVFNCKLLAGKNSFRQQITVPNAKTWDLETPNLYTCRLSVKQSKHTDSVERRFGFRVMEVREDKQGVARFFFNGKRFRHKSAIDWGFYAHTGAYATEEMATRSVQAAKIIGHNGINFHRQIGEPLVMDKADELGLYLYEEPGGVKSGDLSKLAKLSRTLFDRENIDKRVFKIEKNTLAMALMKEKIRRMIVRDRNHPSILFYTLSNEDKLCTPYRKELLALINNLDDSRLIVNSSGTTNTPATVEFLKAMSQFNGSTFKTDDKRVVKINKQYNYRPYSNRLTTDHVDAHSVASRSAFQEDILSSHQITETKPTRYWGEVACYTGPSNWYKTSEASKKLPHGQTGYDNNIYNRMLRKVDEVFDDWHLAGSCSGAILSKSDLSKQAGRSLMYTNGRLCQAICSQDGIDGFAINGWSSGPQVGDKLENLTQRIGMDWDSAIVDEARNLKGPAEDYAYWTRPLQIAIFRDNGKYFTPGDIAQFNVVLINEGRLKAGSYSLRFSIIDGCGINHSANLGIKPSTINVIGGDCFSQPLCPLKLTLRQTWHGGHITIKGELFDGNGSIVANGKEQVLLNNPSSLRPSFKTLFGAVYQWSNAEIALRAAKIKHTRFSDTHYKTNKSYDFIAAGELPNQMIFQKLLTHVENGTTLIIHFTPAWATLLYDSHILSEPVTEWGCKQEGFWYGNGWGYIGEFVGDQAVPSRSVIGTNSWETQGDPEGFYPFKSTHPSYVHALWMARHDIMRVLIATIQYGKGKIILNPAYKLHNNNAVSNMIFYNILKTAKP